MKTTIEIKEYKDTYAADLQAAIDRQAKRNPKATAKLVANIKRVNFQKEYK